MENSEPNNSNISLFSTIDVLTKDMIKRIFAVAELLSKAKTEQDRESSSEEATYEIPQEE